MNNRTSPDIDRTMTADPKRVDYSIISEFIPQNAKVLDVGSGDGALLALLTQKKRVKGRGIEISQQRVSLAVSQGISVIQGDADIDLCYYPNDGFDYVILSQTIQAMRSPQKVLEELLRIGHHVIISFPNFGYWRMRSHLLFKGQMPVTKHLPYSWHDTPNIHFCTIRDFVILCNEINAKIENFIALNGRRNHLATKYMPLFFSNIFAEQAVFLLSRQT